MRRDNHGQHVTFRESFRDAETAIRTSTSTHPRSPCQTLCDSGWWAGRQGMCTAPCALRPAPLHSAASQKHCESSAQSESKAARSSGFRKRWHEAMRWPERGRRRPSISLLPWMSAFGQMALSIGTEQPHCDAGYMGYMWASIAVGTQQPPFWRACTSSPVPDAFICSQEAASRMRSECSSRGYFFLPTRIVQQHNSPTATARRSRRCIPPLIRVMSLCATCPVVGRVSRCISHVARHK